MVVIAIKPDVDITNDVYWLLEDGDAIKDGGSSSKYFCVTATDNHGGEELTDNSSETRYLKRGRSVCINDGRP